MASMISQDLGNSLPPTAEELPYGASAFEAQRATKHHDRVAEVPTVSQPPAIAKGDRTRSRDPETEDLGWSEDPKVPVPVVEGINNENLWILVRRFNKQVFHLRRIPDPPPGVLDCTSAISGDTYSPDKLRSALERFYLTIVVGIASTLKHIARIRSWTETSRTACFCFVYFTSWYKDLLVPAFLVFLLTLILSPSTRPIFFPPAPLAAIDSKTGQVKKPAAGWLGSIDGITGAEERFRGDAVGEGGRPFLGKEGNGASPMHDEEEEDQSPPSPANKSPVKPDVTDVAGTVGAQRAASTTRDISEDSEKQTAVPVQQAMWDNVGIVMSALGVIMDIWEMTANALTATPPFEPVPMHIRIASPIALMFLISLVLPRIWIYRSLTFGIRIGFIRYIDRVLGTQWRWYLDIRNTILLGAPTDNQLTLTLLRLGETKNSPLPPPPPSKDNTSSECMLPPPVQLILAGDDDETESNDDDNTKPKRSKKLLDLVKATTKISVTSVLSIEKAKATLGSTSGKARTGIVKTVGKAEEEQRDDGPSVFRGKWEGKKGVLTVSTAGTQALVAFSRLPGFLSLKGMRNPGEKEKEVLENPAETVVWSLAIDDIREVRKVGGFGWKGKIAVGWSTGDKVIDGLEIIDMNGTAYFITALPRRNEMFNRLVAIGKQRWESC
ncbi:hypothetical protein BT96DRAFT_971828 [Gymnopus androsaceus JB14]|uniref:Uncharacterized protein n=1 Tax=Gymnopus androsaceus JB14 TaxID=1447944 RepID=A0A6A4I9M6_9AGAR|nr:hypothetical protein BT96DRAFT_971828 [Gymnopus androsaceus JB14]